jgi:hypothetical protein
LTFEQRSVFNRTAMKIFSYILFFLLVSAVRADYIRLISTNGQPSTTFTVNPTEVAIIREFYGTDYGRFIYQMDGVVITNDAPAPGSLPKITVIQGPATIQLQTFNIVTSTSQGDVAVAIIELKRGIPDVQISNTVVIPEDSSGPVHVVLESSADLVTWTAANPGTYGSSTQKRFFRLRTVRQ